MTKSPIKGLAERLRQARIRMPDVKQADAGQVVGRSAPCITQWETGKSEPSFADLMTLAKFYGVSVDWLLGLDSQAAKDTASLMTVQSMGTQSVPVYDTAFVMEPKRKHNGPIRNSFQSPKQIVPIGHKGRIFA